MEGINLKKLRPSFDFFEAPPEVLSAAYSFFTTIDASQLRGTSKALRVAVMSHPWNDDTTLVVHPERWRACFPHATAAAVAYRAEGYGASFAHFSGVKILDLHQAYPIDSDLGFVSGISRVDFGYVDTLTSASIERLILNGCTVEFVVEADILASCVAALAAFAKRVCVAPVVDLLTTIEGAGRYAAGSNHVNAAAAFYAHSTRAHIAIIALLEQVDDLPHAALLMLCSACTLLTSSVLGALSFRADGGPRLFVRMLDNGINASLVRGSSCTGVEIVVAVCTTLSRMMNNAEAGSSACAEDFFHYGGEASFIRIMNGDLIRIGRIWKNVFEILSLKTSESVTELVQSLVAIITPTTVRGNSACEALYGLTRYSSKVAVAAMKSGVCERLVAVLNKTNFYAVELLAVVLPVDGAISAFIDAGGVFALVQLFKQAVSAKSSHLNETFGIAFSLIVTTEIGLKEFRRAGGIECLTSLIAWHSGNISSKSAVLALGVTLGVVKGKK